MRGRRRRGREGGGEKGGGEEGGGEEGGGEEEKEKEEEEESKVEWCWKERVMLSDSCFTSTKTHVIALWCHTGIHNKQLGK